MARTFNNFRSNSRRLHSRISGLMAAAVTLAIVSSVRSAAPIVPTGIAHGAATFATHGPLTTITAANQTIIDYSRFNIPAGDTVRFIQPNAAATVLNRVNSADPSRIDGNMYANGIVYLANPSGVLFGPHSVVDVGQIYAAASHISNADFLAGNNHFTGANGLVNNEGFIQASAVNLIGQQVANEGTILAPSGMVALVAGNDVYLGKRDGSVYVQIKEAASAAAGQGGTAKAGVGVSNTGTINAAGGSVNLTAGDMYSIAARQSGTITAANITVKGGSNSTVLVSGKLDASNQGPNQTGGTVNFGGGQIGIGVSLDDNGNFTYPGASINASGKDGGGKILIGVKKDSASSSGYADAANYDFISANSVLNANATVSGNGGFIDTSGGVLQIDPRATITATGAGSGVGGTWLLDPFNVDIVDQSAVPSGGYIVGGKTASSGGYYLFVPPPNNSLISDLFTTPALTYVTVQSIENELDAGTSVTVATWGGNANTILGLTPGNIDVQAPITVTYNAGAPMGATLSLDATNQITIEPAAEISATNGPLSITLNAGENGDSSSSAGQPGITIDASITTFGGHLYAYTATESPSSNLLDLASSISQNLGASSLLGLLENIKIGNWSFIVINAPINTLAADGATGGAVTLSSQSYNPLSGLWSDLLNRGLEFSTSLISVNSSLYAGSVFVGGDAHVTGVAGQSENLAANALSIVNIASTISARGSVNLESSANSGDAAGISMAVNSLMVSGNVSSAGMNLNGSATAGMASIISLAYSNTTCQGDLSSTGGTIKLASSSSNGGQAIAGGSFSSVNLGPVSDISGGATSVSSQSYSGTQNASLAPQFTRVLGISAESFIQDILPVSPVSTITISGNISSSNIAANGEINTDGGYCTMASGAYSNGAEQSGVLTSAVAALESLVSTHPGLNLSLTGIGVTSSVAADGGYIKTGGGNLTLYSQARDTGDGGGGVFIYTGSNVTETAPIYAGDGAVTVYANAATDQTTDLAKSLLSLLLATPLSGDALKSANPQTFSAAISDILDGNGIKLDLSPTGVGSFLASLFSADFSLSSVLLNAPINAGALAVESGVPAAEPGGQVGVGLSLGIGGIVLGQDPINAVNASIGASAVPSGVSLVGPTLTLTGTISGTLFLGTGSVTTSGGGQAFTGPVLVAGDSNLTDTGEGNITFGSTVDGTGSGSSLTITTCGDVTFGGNVAGISQLGHLSVSADQVSFNGADDENVANRNFIINPTCAGGGTPPPSQQFTLPGASEWDGSGITVQSGQTITISASGEVYIGNVSPGLPSVSNYQTPAGDPNFATANLGGGTFAAPGLVPWSLVGRIGQNGTPFEIGTGTTITASASGQLYLSVNDNNFGDDSGTWNVSVQIAGGAGGGSPVLVGATALSQANSLTLPSGAQVYLFGEVNGGLFGANQLVSGSGTAVSDAAGNLATEVVSSGQSTNSFSTNAADYDIVGVGVSGFSNMQTLHGQTVVSDHGYISSGTYQASVSFTTAKPTLMVAVGLGSSQQGITFQGPPGLVTDATTNATNDIGIGLSNAAGIAHAYLNAGSYTIGETTTIISPEMETGHIVDLLGVYLFTGSGSGTGGGSPPPVNFIPPPAIQPPPAITSPPENNNTSSTPIINVGGALTSINNAGAVSGNPSGSNTTENNTTISFPGSAPSTVLPQVTKAPVPSNAGAPSSNTTVADNFFQVLFPSTTNNPKPPVTSALTSKTIITNGSSTWAGASSSTSTPAKTTSGGGLGAAIGNFLSNTASAIGKFFGSLF